MRGLSARTKELIEVALALLQRDHPMTLRQLHYAIFSAAIIPYLNDQAHYKRLSRATTTARRTHREWELAGEIGREPAYSIPSAWMVDETRQPETVSVWQDVHEYLDCTKRDYRRDNWQDQPRHVEVWSEKATVLGSIRPVADELGITLRVCHALRLPAWKVKSVNTSKASTSPSPSSFWAITIHRATSLSTISMSACSGPPASSSACCGWRFTLKTSASSTCLRSESSQPILEPLRSKRNLGRGQPRSNWTRFLLLNCVAESRAPSRN